MSRSSSKPSSAHAARVRVAVSMGDPAGIGPEVTLKALRHPAVRRAVELVLVGDPRVFERLAERHGWHLRFAPFDPEGVPPQRGVPVFEVPMHGPVPEPGLPRTRATRARCGDASYRALLAAVDLVRSGRAHALVTAPIAKAHWALAGHDAPGHTELLARLCGGVPVRMMMAGPRLRVVLMTTHLPLALVPQRVTSELVDDTIRITAAALRERFGMPSPRLALAGLNPHAGEGGLFGSEDEQILRPAVQRARRRGINVIGPLPADTVFFHAAEGAFDAVLSPYHDQGLGPFKLLHFRDGVNVTLGLPFVRTSPDHGTAFDIAGQDRADPESMVQALLLAAKMAERSLRRQGK